MQHLAHHHVVGNHAAAEDHGDEHHNGQKAIELITGAGEHVAHQGGEGNAYYGTNDCDLYRNQQSLQNGILFFPQELIGRTGKFMGDELIAILSDGGLRGDGNHEYVENGDDTAQTQNQKEHIEQRVGSRFNAVQLVHGIIICRFTHIPTSYQISALSRSTRRTIQFAIRIVIQPTTAWKKEAAAVRPRGTPVCRALKM